MEITDNPHKTKRSTGNKKTLQIRSVGFERKWKSDSMNISQGVNVPYDNSWGGMEISASDCLRSSSKSIIFPIKKKIQQLENRFLILDASRLQTGDDLRQSVFL